MGRNIIYKNKKEVFFPKTIESAFDGMIWCM